MKMPQIHPNFMERDISTDNPYPLIVKIYTGKYSKDKEFISDKFQATLKMLAFEGYMDINPNAGEWHSAVSVYGLTEKGEELARFLLI